MTRFSLLLFLFLPFLTKAQTEPVETDTTETVKILIIPFEEKLFYCDIMRDLTSVNQLSQQQIYDRLRNEIQLSLKAALKDSMETATFLSTDSISEAELVNIYAVLGYEFLPVPVEVKEESGKKKKSSTPAKPKQEVGIRGGQVVAEREATERYMSAQLKSHDILQQFHSRYGINRFLFVNQMDLKMDLSDPEMAFIDPKRVVAIHFTIMDKEGKQISGGLASEQFSGTESNINHIIGSTFYKLSTKVMSSLFAEEKKETAKTKTRKPKGTE